MFIRIPGGNRKVEDISLSHELGEMVANLPLHAVPPPVLARAKVSLLHNLAVGLAGRRLERVAHVAAQTYWAQPAEATLLCNGRQVNAEGAALANAALMNIRSQDDTHAPSTSHPGSPTIGAALAMAESCGRSGLEFLVAVVLGYETLCRIGRDFDDQFTARGFRAAALLGGFGATVAAARLLRLNGAQTAHAIGLQVNFAGGVAQVWREGSAEAAWQIGMGARNGIVSARAAACGATSAAQALEGQAGFFQAFAGQRTGWEQVSQDFGTAWVFPEITVKALPVCAILQGPAALFIDLVRQHDLHAADIAGITLTLNPYEADYPGIDNAGPFASAIATKLSAQFCLGLAVTDRRITPDSLARVTDEQVLALARLVTVERDETVVPRLSRLAVRLTNGQALHGAVEAPVGKPDFSACADFVMSLAPEIGARDAAVSQLIAAVAVIDSAPDLKPLIAACAGCTE
jgi:2-methylcitrate dehydratase PrpD